MGRGPGVFSARVRANNETEPVVTSATDRANALAVDVLPFVFIAKNDMDESVGEEFAKTWSENTGGSGSIKLYLKEIVQLSTENLSSARWSARQTCASALAEAARSMCMCMPRSTTPSSYLNP